MITLFNSTYSQTQNNIMVRYESKVVNFNHNMVNRKGESPGLVVKGRDSQSEGCEFKFRSLVLDGYFSHQFVGKL